LVKTAKDSWTERHRCHAHGCMGDGFITSFRRRRY